MATPSRHFDPATVEEQVLAVARELLRELGGVQNPASLSGSAHLERDLGLGSLERVELLVRLRRTFGAELPETVITESTTLAEIITAVPGAYLAVQAQTRIIVEGRKEDARLLSGAATEEPDEARLHALDGAQTWQEVIRHRGVADAGRTHVILWEDDEQDRLSFGDLYAGARRVAGALARRGIVPGDSVGIMLPTCREFFEVFAGVLLAGGVPVPIYPPLRADRVAEYAERQARILQNAEARVLVTFREAAGLAKLLQPSIPSLQSVETAARLCGTTGRKTHKDGDAGVMDAEWHERIAAGGSDLALLQYTSGSTGDPKGVKLTHGNLLANVRAIGEAVDARPNDVGVSWLPLYHDMGLIGNWLLPLYFGVPVVMLSPLAFLTRPERWLWALHKHRGTFTAAPNFAYELATRKVEDAAIEGLDLSSVRAALNGAEPVSLHTLERFAARYSKHGFRREALMPVYGLAEGSLAVCIPPLGRGPRAERLERQPFVTEGRAIAISDASSRQGGAAPNPEELTFVSVGSAVPNHEVRIVDAAGEEAPERVEGELWFRGPSTTGGYFHNQTATEALFPKGRGAGWLRSGDRAYRAGGEIFITGRVKEIILKAGRNLYPQEIEELTAEVPGVRKGCVVAFGVADAASGTERLVIAAETREGTAATREKLTAAINQRIASAIGLPPDIVRLLPPRTIPKTSSGKLRRAETRRRYLAATLEAQPPAAWRQIARLAVSSTLRRAVRGLLRWLRWTAEKLYGIYALTLFGFWIVPTWIGVKLAPSRAAARRIALLGLRSFMTLAGCRVRVRGERSLDLRKPWVYVCNHASYFDILAVTAALGTEYRFVAKGEVRRMPFFGTFLRKLGHFAFDRSDPHDRARQMADMEQALRDGESLFVFPEGTFTPETGVRPFQLGAFKAAATAQCPIVPVALKGTRRFLRDGTYLPRPAAISVTICPPIQPKALTGQGDWRELVRLRDRARLEIAREVGEPLTSSRA